MTVLSESAAWDLCDRCGKNGRLLVQVEIDGESYDRESAEPCPHPMIRAAEAKVLAVLAAREKKRASNPVWVCPTCKFSCADLDHYHADCEGLVTHTKDPEARTCSAAPTIERLREVCDALERHGYANPQACTIDTIVEEVNAGRAAAGPAAEAQMELAALRRRVAEPDLSGDHVIEVLSQPCFEFINLARLWRDTGTEIPRKAEQEQAFFLHAQLVYAIAHGVDWRQQFFAVEIEPRLAQARAAIAKEPQDA